MPAGNAPRRERAGTTRRAVVRLSPVSAIPATLPRARPTHLTGPALWLRSGAEARSRAQPGSGSAAEEDDAVGADAAGGGEEGGQRVDHGAGERAVLGEGLGGYQDQARVLPAGSLVLRVQRNEVLDVRGDEGAAASGSLREDLVVREADQGAVGDDGQHVVVL